MDGRPFTAHKHRDLGMWGLESGFGDDKVAKKAKEAQKNMC